MILNKNDKKDKLKYFIVIILKIYCFNFKFENKIFNFEISEF
jgi:hypothetical protein